MEAAGFAPGMRGAPAARRVGLDLQAAAGGAGARRAMSAARPRFGHLAVVVTARSSICAAFKEVCPPRREFAVMAAAAARGAGPAAAVDPGLHHRRSTVAVAAAGAPSAAEMRGLRRWSVAAGSAGRRFFCGSGNLQAAEGGAGAHRVFSMSAAASNLGGGDHIAPPTSYGAHQEACVPRRASDGTAGGTHVWQGKCFFFSAAGDLASSPASMALHSRHAPHAKQGNQDAPSDSDDTQSDGKPKSEKKTGPRTLEEFMDAHPRSIAFLKLVMMASCVFLCYLSSKGDPRVKLLVESAKDARG